MDQQEMQGGVIAIKCISGQNEGWLDTISPLGTLDEDGNITSESSSDLTVAGNYKKSQAFMGGFERFFGKIGVSDAIDQQASENNDVSTGPDKVKAYEDITAQLELNREYGMNRLEGAIKGKWNPTSRAYNRYRSFRAYEVIVAFDPNVQNLQMTSAELLRRFIGVRPLRVEHTYGNPNTFRLPIFARRQVDFTFWEEPTPTDMFTSPPSTVAGSFTPDNNIQDPDNFHTRLKFTFDSLTTGGVLQIKGDDIFGRSWTEEVTIGDSDEYYITKQYFSRIHTNGIVLGAGFAGGTFDVEEYDVKIQPDFPA